MNESEMKRRIVETVRKEGGYARRIEDQFSVGMPDLILMPLRCPVIWAEAKIVTGQTFGPTQRQLHELTALRRSPYSVPMMIGYKNGKHYIAPPALKIKLDQCDEQQEAETVADLIRRAISHV